jgi:hypothetical protein
MLELASAFWTAANQFQPQFIAFGLTAVAAFVTYLSRAKVKLIYGRANNSFHKIAQKDGFIAVYSEKHYIQNVGRKPAERVDVIFSNSPSELAVYPPSEYEKGTTPEGNYIIKLPYISPRQLFIIDTLHINQQTAEIVSVKCPEQMGKRVEFWVQRKFSSLIYFITAVTILFGFYYFVELVVRFMIYVTVK